MHSAVIILTLVSIAYAGTVPYLERISKVTERQVTVNGGNDNSFFNIHDIPTYPDYVNTTQANSPRTESHSIPTTTAVQISGWSFRNVVSSLSPFVTSLFLPGSHISSFLLRFLVVVLLSVASAALICVYTPTCNVNFPGKVKASRNIFILRN